jgi:acyl carrier protein
VELTALIAVILEVDPSMIDDESSPATVDGWDSLAHISVIAGIEETYSVSLTAAEMRDAKCVGDLRRLLRAKNAIA